MATKRNATGRLSNPDSCLWNRVNSRISTTNVVNDIMLIAEKSFSVKFGARNMRRYIQREVEDQLAEKLLADQKHAITQIRLSVSGGRLTIDCM